MICLNVGIVLRASYITNLLIIFRFIDIVRGEKLHMWSTEPADCGFASLVSAICSCGSDKTQSNSSHSWIAVGLSSGNCRLLDSRSGNVIASWRAHDGYVTKVPFNEKLTGLSV